jgi:hypothetical protein
VTPAPVGVLTSGVGLGAYVPALLNEQALQRAGRPACVEVIESLFNVEHQRRLLAHRDAFRSDFRLANLAQRMGTDVTAALDVRRVDAVLGRWIAQRRRSFILWSGFWLPVLERYCERAQLEPDDLRVDACRIDAVISASFVSHANSTRVTPRDVWLWRDDEQRLDWRIPVCDLPSPAFATRGRRVVVHGGGWAIGTYLESSSALSAAGWDVDVVAPVGAPVEFPVGASAPRCRRFAPPPDWHPWCCGSDGRHQLPPLLEHADDGWQFRSATGPWPAVHDLVRAARAIVSKPGGGTLIDSLDSATPLVLLEPYGEAEARSGALWERLGFGISWSDWEASRFDDALLEPLHRNLAAARAARAAYPPADRP